MQQKKLGELLISNRLITEEQFAQALEIQRLCPKQPIGQLLCQLNFLTAADLQMFLDINDKRQKLGAILIGHNLIDEKMLKAALELSKQEGTPLGRALIKLHILEEEQLAQLIAVQQDLPYVALDSLTCDKELASLFNPSYAQRHKIIPIKREGKHVTLAIAYPLSREFLRNLESLTQLTIAPVIAKESDILLAQHHLYALSRETPLREEFHFEITEDSVKDSVRSKYVKDVISADADYLVKKIIATGIKGGASDIHLESSEQGVTVRFRVDGVLRKLDLGNDAIYININARQIISKVKILCDMDIAERRRPQDSSFKMKVTKDGVVRNVDFRVSTVLSQFGENVVIRILDKKGSVFSLESLGFFQDHEKELYRALEKPTGIFLVTGPTGSGKSSTLYALLTKLNTPGVKTLTVEDPIEYMIDGICQTEVHEIIGNTFAKLLRTFLRHDPDIIMVGEIRDVETASIAIRAALTGHTVLSTLHTNDATSAIIRLLDMQIEPGLLATTIKGVLAQRLVRKVCDQCTCRHVPANALLEEFALSPKNDWDFCHGKGCPSCNFSGFTGRLPIGELWIPTREELLFLTRMPDNLTLRERVFSGKGRITMVEDGLRRVRQGETTLEELIRVIPYEQIAAQRFSDSARLT